jgi:HD-like signal output (HDOD) protein
MRLLEISRNPDNGPAEFARPIEADPGLTSQVLCLVNSSYYGFAQEISSVKLAISMVGVRTVRNFALWNAVFSLVPNPKCGPFHLKGLWQDSLRRALFARAIVGFLGIKEAEDVFTAALLQDMAVPLLAKGWPAVYAKLLQARNQGKTRLSVVEKQVFGWTHADAAGMMARQWNLPEEFAVLVESHLTLDRWAATVPAEPAKFAMALSALLPSVADPVWTEHGLLEAAYEGIGRSKLPSLAELLEQTDSQFERFAPVLKLSTPVKSLSDSLNEVAEPALAALS